MTRFHVARMRSVQADDPTIVCHLELTASLDPARPVPPGESVDFQLKLVPEGENARYYGYLMVESFDKVATVAKASGMSLAAVGDRYVTSTTAGAERVATFTLKTNEDAGADAYFVPQLRAGIIAGGGKSLTSTTITLKNEGFRIAPLPPQGRSLTVMPGYRAVVKSLTEGLGESVRLRGVGPARHGMTSVEPDGTVSYTPYDRYLGYDWFEYLLDDGAGRYVSGQVTVFVGDTSAVPGVLPS
ncbi:Ig-like domain-containing protein [Streptomyces sp. NPDC006879]|uniref:Ig-like domain-containing protein n=1 Tax=Streptomyces sp. NPDC006879 TaxID=3364767 RepID=UPI0036816E11